MILLRSFRKIPSCFEVHSFLDFVVLIFAKFHQPAIKIQFAFNVQDNAATFIAIA